MDFLGHNLSPRLLQLIILFSLSFSLFFLSFFFFFYNEPKHPEAWIIEFDFIKYNFIFKFIRSPLSQSIKKSIFQNHLRKGHIEE